jgi:large subunit ribosomal protein L25
MEVVRMKAERRTQTGRNQVAQIRKQGWLPAVVYGEGGEPVSLSISEWEFEQHMKAHRRVFQLEFDGRKQDAYLQEVQWAAMEDRPRHVDFRRIDLTKPMDFEVQISFSGHPVGLGKGGVLIKDHPTIKIRCLPTAIPDSLVAKIQALDIEQSFQAKDVILPEGVTLVVSPELVVCHVAKLVVEVAPAPVAAPVAEGEEGAPPAAAGAVPAAPAKDAKAPEKAEKADKGDKK